MKFAKVLILFALLISTISLVTGDLGCPREGGKECKEHCQRRGQDGKCERRWYRWRYRWRCKCNPCKGTLVLGACINRVPTVGVNCDTDPWKCKPTGK